jgi:group I intron endonuclease
MLICRALLKYGYSNFSLEILEYCEPENAIKREQYFLDLLNPEYNILKTAGSSLGRKHSVEAKAKMAEGKLGRKLSEETKLKISDYRTGRVHSAETKAKMAAANLGR